MSPKPDRLQELLRDMRGSVSPVDAPEAARARRERTVAGMRAVQGHAATRRALRATWRRRLIVAAFVLTSVGALGASSLMAWGPFERAAPEASATAARRVEQLRATRTPASPRAAATDASVVATPQPSAALSRNGAVAGPAHQASHAAKAAPRETSTLAEENRIMQSALSAGRAGDDSTEVRLLSDLLATHPGSPLAQNARVEMFRALRRSGNERSAVEAARRYLSQYPNGMASAEARRLVATAGDTELRDDHSR
jgi:hypothetical protein